VGSGVTNEGLYRNDPQNIIVDTSNISSNSFDADPVMFSHTVASGTNAFIYVAISVEGGFNVNDVDWGTTQLTPLREDINVGVCRSEIWYAALGDLGSDTTNTVTVNLDSQKKTAIGAIGIHGVAQTGSIDTEGGTSGIGDPSVNLTTNFDGSLLLDNVCSESTALTQGALQIEMWEHDNGVAGAGSNETTTSSGPYTMSYDLADNGKKQAYSTVAIKALAGKFVDVTTPALITTADPDGAAWGDYDNDGDLDLLLSQDGGVSELWRNENDGTFTNQAVVAGFGSSGDLGKTVGFFDSDNDGDLDVLVNRPVTFWRNDLYDHQTPLSNANEYLKVIAFGNGTAGTGSPKTPIGAQIDVTDISGTLLAHREVIPSQNQLAPPHMQHFGGLDPNTEYNVIVKFPSGTVTTYEKCIPSNLRQDIHTVYGSYTVPQTLNATETSGDKTIKCTSIQVDVNDDTAILDDEIISVIVKRGDLMQPDAGAPGMKLAVQLIGGTYSDTDVITTDSSDIVIGPVVVTDSTGAPVSSGGTVLTTTFFINNTAAAQSVEVSINGNSLVRTFEIVIPEANSGDFTGQGAGPHPLGNGVGRNGTRTVGGTIVLESLIVPTGVNLIVTTSDIDPTRDGNQGYLPAIILVAGDVDIQGTGTIDVSGGDALDGDNDNGGDGGVGGPGGAGGGGGAGDGQTSGSRTGGDGGDGLTGGGAAGANSDFSGSGGTGGEGTGGTGSANAGATGGAGGPAFFVTTVGGGGGLGDSNAGAGGGGGTGYVYGTSGGGGGGNVSPGAGGLGGAGGSANTDDNPAGGAGFGRPGAASGDGEGGLPGSANNNDQLVPFAGGSGGGGGGSDDDGGNDDGSGGGGGGGGALLIYAYGEIDVVGTLLSQGGTGGAHDGDSGDASGGGGGSGGAIILQASDVTATAGPGTLDVTGGAPGEANGDGGDGRLRIDGLPQGVSTFAGITRPVSGGAQGPPTEFVGPAIISANQSHVVGTAAAGADIEANIWDGTLFNIFSGTADGVTGDFELSVSYSPGANYITVIQNTTGDTVSVMSSAATWIMHTRSIEDSVTADDQIFAKAKMKLEDTTITEDIITKRVFIQLIDGAMLDAVTITDQISIFASIDTLNDSATVDDFIITKILRFRTMEDTVDIDDSISFKAFIRLNDGVRGDSVTIADLITTKSLFFIEDSASVDDFITPVLLTFRTIEDAVDIDDSISFKAFIRLNDGARGDSATLADLLSAKSSIKTMSDSATIADFITKQFVVPLEDSSTINDSITKVVRYNIEDSATVDDSISMRVFIRLTDGANGDSATVADFITKQFVVPLEDSSTINDSITKVVRYNIEDSATVDDILGKKFKTRLEDSATVDDTITVTFTKEIEDSATIDDSITKKVFIRLTDGARGDSATLADLLSAKSSIKTMSDSATVDDTIFAVHKTTIEDAVAMEDSISFKVFIRLTDGARGDSATLADLLSAKSSIKTMSDSATVDDTIFAVRKTTIEDAVVVEDSISIKVSYFIEDEVLIDDFITAVFEGLQLRTTEGDSANIDDLITTNLRYLIQDSATVDDSIFVTIKRSMEDSATVDDSDTISIKAFIRLTDGARGDSATLADLLSAKSSIKAMSDSATVDDSISIKVSYFIEDKILVDDTISFKLIAVRKVEDEVASVDDQLSACG